MSSGSALVIAAMDKGRAIANKDKPLANLTDNGDAILAELKSGKSGVEVAASLGISHQSLYEWLIRNRPDDWLAASSAKSLARIEKAEIDLDSAEDQVQISRARESARIAQWQLERTSRRLYGDNKGESGVNIQVVVDRGCGGITINGEQT